MIFSLKENLARHGGSHQLFRSLNWEGWRFKASPAKSSQDPISNITVKIWRCGSSSREPAFREVLSSNPSPPQEKRKYMKFSLKDLTQAGHPDAGGGSALPGS
jgi:hypothetical protein